MFRRPFLTSLALLAVCFSLGIGDADRVEAQRLLQRLRQRIQDRGAAPAVQPQSAATRPAAPASGVAPASGAAARPMQRLQPILRPRGQQNEDASQPGDGDTSQRSRFGRSILVPRGDSQADRAAPAATPGASLGIDVVQQRGRNPGSRVVGFRDQSRAEQAGLREGDVIVAIDGRETPTIADVAAALASRRAGEEVKATVIREDGPTDLVIPLMSRRVMAAKPPAGDGSQPRQSIAGGAEELAETLGLAVQDADGVRGAVVARVLSGQAAEQSGLKAGDRIVAVEGRVVANAAQLGQRVAELAADQPVKLRVVRDGQLINTDLTRNAASAPGSAVVVGDQPASAISGIGSVLGGLFGGPAKPAETVDTAEEVASQAGSPSQAAAEPGGVASTEAAEVDVMALDDDEPVRQVDFEQIEPTAEPPGNALPAPRPAEPAETEQPLGLNDDPPSLSAFELPPPSIVEPVERRLVDRDTARVIEELREEVRRLKEKIRQLESQQP